MEKKRLYGLSLLLSIWVLFMEAALAFVVSDVYASTQESPNYGGGSPLFILFLPVLAVLGAFVAAGLSVAFVLPTAWLSDVLGRRFGGREVWWWVPPVAAAVSLVLVGVAVAVRGGGEPGDIALWWLLTTAALTVPALLWRSPRERIFGPVTLWGLGTVILTGVLGSVALSTGLLQEYRPPTVTSAEVVGRWSDGRGGTLTFGADGQVTAVGIEDDLHDRRFEDSADEEGREGGADSSCTGQGTWTYDAGASSWAQEVGVTVDTCASAEWSVGGTESRPTLYQYIGDPDSWDLYKLTKVSAGS